MKNDNERDAPLVAAVQPLRVTNAAGVSWTGTADVVVVGFGGAGAAAAIEARECGASVIAVDRFDGGGATAYSGGVIYAGGTRYQRESGINDTPEEMFKYLKAEGSPVTDDTLRRFCQGSSAALEWLERHGVPHGGNAFLQKTQFPPNPHYLYFSGNENMPSFAAIAKPAPRGHRTVAEGFGGHVHYARLERAALELGVILVRHAPVTRLVVAADGAVIGVEINELPPALHAEHTRLYKVVNPWRPFNNDRADKAIQAAQKLEDGHGGRRLIRALGGVVLATGGFIQNVEMLRQYRPSVAKYHKVLLRIGCLADDGSGMQLGRSVGGKTALMDVINPGRTLAPPNILPHGIIINQAGKRFLNESAYANILGEILLELPGSGKAWLILSAAQFRTALKQSFFPGSGMFWKWGAPALLNILMGGTRRAGSLGALAKKLGIDPVGLKETVSEHNAMVQRGVPDQFGKAPSMLHTIPDGAHYALNVSMENKYLPGTVLTMGGLDVDESTGAVKSVSGIPIKGLYAAGRVSVGVCSMGKGYVSGLSIADTVFGGRRAGHAAAATR